MGNPNEVRWMETSVLKDRKVFERWFYRMSEERQKKIRAFRREQDQRLSLAAGILLESGLYRRGIIPAEIGYGRNGKPFYPGEREVFFNLTHSGQMAVCVFSDREVGVDCEKIRYFEPKLADYVFYQEEQETARSGRFENEDEGYTYLWTVKESLMKYFGTGLSLEPKKILTDGSKVRVSDPQYETGNLFFTSCRLGEYRMTICSPYELFAEENGIREYDLTEGGCIFPRSRME